MSLVDSVQQPDRINKKEESCHLPRSSITLHCVCSVSFIKDGSTTPALLLLFIIYLFSFCVCMCDSKSVRVCFLKKIE